MTRAVALAVAVATAGLAAAQPIGVTRPPQPDSFGQALAPLGAQLIVGEEHRARLVDPFTNAILQTFDLPGAPGNVYGTVVAGGGTTALVTNDKVYMFDAPTGTFVRSFTTPGAPGDGFGVGLAVLGGDVLVGAPYGPTGGAVYLFDGGTGALVRTFNAPVPAAGDDFGRAIVVFGGSLLVGTPGDDTAASNGGTAYLFDAGTGALLQTFINPAPVAEDRFGQAVAAGAGGALIGAPGDTFPVPAAGRAYAFNSGSGALLQTFSTPGSRNLGASVAWLGDDALVGAVDPSAYVFDGSTGSPIRTLSNFLGSFGFGAPVAVVDGHPVVGAGVDGLGADFYQGAVFVYCGGSAGCGPCETCGPGGTCVLAPHPTCHAPLSGRFSLRVVNGSRDASDLVAWSGKGNFDGVFLEGDQSGAGGNLSNPLAAGPDYTLCAYDESTPTPALLFRATAPAAGTCAGNACWKEGVPCTYERCGFTYRDGEKTPEGVVRLGAKILTNDAPPPFQFRFLGRGENLSNRPGGLPAPPFPLPLRVQLQVRDGLCWEAEYPTASDNSGTRFRATTD